MIKNWTKEEDQKLKEIYAEISNQELADMFGVTSRSIRARAHKFKLYKSKEFGDKQRKAGQFKKGNVPFNKGKKQREFMTDEAIEKSKPYRFRKGQKPRNTKPIGYERISVDGYVEIKTEKGFKLKHREVWQKHFGTIPKGMIVVFADGNPLNLNIGNLKLITRQEHVANNTITKYPTELQRAIKLKNKLIKTLSKHGK